MTQRRTTEQSMESKSTTEQRLESTRSADRHYMGVRERFGGIDTPAALGGLMAAIGSLMLLLAILALTTLPLQINAIDIEGEIQELSGLGVAVAAVVILVSFFIGGWVAARIARFDGVINGVGVGLWMLLLVALSAAAGVFLDARYNLLQRAGLPDWFSQIRGDEVTTLAVVAAIVGVTAVFVGAILGGASGEGYNRRVDAALTDGTPVYTERTEPYRSDR